MKLAYRLFLAIPMVLIGALVGCSGGANGTRALPPARGSILGKPPSVSPALIKPAPMARTTILSKSLMVSPPVTNSSIGGLGWTQMPGEATQAVAAQDGSLWALSTAPSGPDKYIWHYALQSSTGTWSWSNISGLADRIAVAPNGTLYAVNSGGGTYSFSNGNWTALGGGASAITAAQDGSIYVLSNGGGGADEPIWHNANGVWTQVNGAGAQLAASWDSQSYTLAGGSVAPDGIYIANAEGNIYYENANGTFVQIPGQASALAPTTYGGLFALGFPTSGAGNSIYYYDLNGQNWSTLPGQAVSVSEAGGHVYAVTQSGLIFQSNAQPSAGPILTNTNVAGIANWSPFDIATSFQFPVQSGYDGTGITIAIVIDGIPAQTDLTQYWSNFAITRRGSFSEESVDGGTTAGSDEATLDTETISGLAPGANVIIYDIPSLSGQQVIDAYNQILSDGKANVVSSSFGGCEYAGVDSTEAPIFAQMAAQGIAAVASSGDVGNECFSGGTSNPYTVGVGYPASDPNVIGVGGMEAPYSGSPPSPIGSSLWNDCPTPTTTPQNCMGSGGISGNSTTGFAGFPIPQYQTAIAGSNGASASLRNVPDVSMPADNDLMRYLNSWYSGAGTSWSAPQVAAMVAEIYQYCGVNAIEDAPQMFYTAFARDGYTDFIDVTSGNNSFMGTTPSFTAGTGYDNVSGIGAPLGMPIAQRICPGNSPMLVQRAPRLNVPLDRLASATPRTLNNVIRTTAADAGPRSANSITTVQFVLRDTPTLAEDENRLVGVLQSAGFTITQRFSDHLVVDATAPNWLVERYFQTQLHNFDQGADGIRFANVLPDTLPASIAPYINGVLTNNLVMARTGPMTLTPVGAGAR